MASTGARAAAGTTRSDPDALAVVGGWLCTGLAEVTSDLSALDSSGFWAVVIDMEGRATCARFDEVRPASTWPGPPWRGPDPDSWRSSLDRSAYTSAVRSIRDEIEAGDVYQVNLTRRLSAPVAAPLAGTSTDIAALGARLAVGNPAPFSAVVRLPRHGLHVASASPERYLSVDGARVWSSPIKGTAPHAEAFLAKDRAENVMIVDLVRNDLGRVCEWGSVTVPALLAVEEHPGLVHLVSTVEGRRRPGVGWAALVEATFPPGSVTGAPKLAALERIRRLEPTRRGVYCGAVGWVDADRDRGDLNVAIRTFWFDDDHLHFGTGAGITHGSDPEGEWEETELKARRLLGLASSRSDAGVAS